MTIHSTPVQFKRNAPFNVNATFTVTPSDWTGRITNFALASTLLSMTATKIGPGSATAQNGSCTVAMPSDGNLPDTAGTISLALGGWLYSVSDGHWRTAGDDTTHKVYLTLNNPHLEFHTCVDYACKIVSISETDIFNSIWGAFAGRAMSRVEGAMSSAPLQYYGHGEYTPQGNPVSTTAALLHAADGRCGEWTCFLYDTLGVHSLSTKVATKYQIKPRLHDIAYINAYNPQGIVIKASLPGQNNSAPYNVFENHAILMIDGMIYDASYGLVHTPGTEPYNDVLEVWEGASLYKIRIQSKTDPSDIMDINPSWLVHDTVLE